MKSSQGDAVESFAVKHSLIWNQLGRFSFSQKGGKTDTLSKKNLKPSPTPPTRRQMGSDAANRVSDFYVLLTVHLGIILVNNQPDAQYLFSYMFYFSSLHASGIYMPIIRRINCINTISGICHSV
jgi:hypothetical protein